MPISRKQFKAGVNAESLKVLEFLFQNKEQAFTAQEISKSMGMDIGKIQKLLAGLGQRGYVEIGIVGDAGYFSLSEKFLEKTGPYRPLGEPFPLNPNPSRDNSEEPSDKTRYIG